MVHPYFDVPGPHVLGHRGAAGVAPENTLLAFARGLELGATMIESDVHATRDGVPVLIHDAEVDRITDGKGRVETYDADALAKLDAGYRFGPGTGHEDAQGPPFPHRGEGLSIPSLREAFEAFPDARFNLEIKARTPGLVPEVVSLVARYGREATTLLTAGDDAVMEELRAVCADTKSDVAIGASLADIVGVVKTAVTREPPPRPDLEVLQIPVDFGGNPLVTPALIDHAHEHGIHIHVWTINDPDEIERLLAMGVDGLVTDFPQRVAQRPT